MQVTRCEQADVDIHEIVEAFDIPQVRNLLVSLLVALQLLWIEILSSFGLEFEKLQSCLVIEPIKYADGLEENSLISHLQLWLTGNPKQLIHHVGSLLPRSIFAFKFISQIKQMSISIVVFSIHQPQERLYSIIAQEALVSLV